MTISEGRPVHVGGGSGYRETARASAKLCARKECPRAVRPAGDVAATSVEGHGMADGSAPVAFGASAGTVA